MDSALEATSESDLRDATAYAEYIDTASRYDGSRTSPQKIALIHEMKRQGRSVNAISEILGMDDRTVKAVLSRQNELIVDARMLLKANALGFAGDLILASQEARNRGKTEGIIAILDRIGVTEPPKNQAQTNVGVQVILHGGGVPSELSLAKPQSHSESLVIQAGNSVGLISQLMDTASNAPQVLNTQAVTEAGDQTLTHTLAPGNTGTVSQQDNTRIQASKCDVLTGRDTL